MSSFLYIYTDIIYVPSMYICTFYTFGILESLGGENKKFRL